MIQTSRVLRKRSYMLTKRYPILVGKVKKNDYTLEIGEVENEIPNITGLVTTFLKVKHLTLLILLSRQLSIQKQQALKKYPMPQVFHYYS